MSAKRKSNVDMAKAIFKELGKIDVVDGNVEKSFELDTPCTNDPTELRENVFDALVDIQHSPSALFSYDTFNDRRELDEKNSVLTVSVSLCHIIALTVTSVVRSS